MFAHLRSKNAVLAKYQFLSKHIATKMRENVRNSVQSLAGFDVSNADTAGVIAEIFMREFACTLNVLNQVHGIASRYHEDAFDNTDDYIEGKSQSSQLSPHEMTAEQRHASQILLGVGNSYSEVNMLLKTLGCGILMKDILECDVAKMQIVAQQFQTSQADEMFDRLHHITKQVWSLVNMLAFSNLFRFADPMQPINMPHPDDSIFIPYIPTNSQPDENTKTLNMSKMTDTAEKTEDFIDVNLTQDEQTCSDCGKWIDQTRSSHHVMFTTGETIFYLCKSCGLKRNPQPNDIKMHQKIYE
jgi:hypothetical protein